MAKSSDGQRYSSENPHVVNEIVDTGMCVRCGACEPACPVDIVRFDDAAYPYLTEESDCIQACTRCLKVCPGGEVDFNALDDAMFGRRPHPQSITGIVRGSYVSFATDDTIREKGASGGFVTHLLTYMLERKLIDGALVVTAVSDKEKGWRQESMIARTVEELRRAQKSKYCVLPALKPLREMEEIEGNYAVVALPCYVHALRKYQKVSPKLRDRLKYIIGLYCNVALEPHAFTDLCEMKGIERRNVTGFDFRFGEWPGGIHISLDGGKWVKVLKHEEMKDEFNTLKLFYTPPRCNTCIDFSAEYADISVGDPWLRGPDGQYLFTDSRTTVLTRTDAGVDVVNDAVRDGYINIEPIPLETYMVNFEKAARYKRDLAPKNIVLRRQLGLRAPEYGRPILPGKRSPWALRKAIKANALHLAANYKWIRKLGMRLAQLPPVILYFRWNRKRKARKFAQAYPKSLEFVRSLRRPDDGEAPQTPSRTAASG